MNCAALDVNLSPPLFCGMLKARLFFLWRRLEQRRDASVDAADRLQGLFGLRLANSLERQIARISPRYNILVQHRTLVH